MNFSIAIIARNEEKTLPRLLESLREYRDCGGEILVLDGDSTDATVDVAKAAGCKVVRQNKRFIHEISVPWAREINQRFVKADEQPVVYPGDRLFDFGRGRNFIGDMCQQDMVFMPDADEVLTAFDIDAVEEVIRLGDTGRLFSALCYARDSSGAPVIQFSHCKFYDRRECSWSGIAHEVVAAPGGRTSTFKVLPDHVLFLEHQQNEDRDRGHALKALALGCYLNPNDHHCSHYLGRELLRAKRTHSAIAEFKRHVALNGPHIERAQSMIYIGDGHMKLEEPEVAAGWYHRAFQLDPCRREALMRLADVAYQQHQAQAVLAYATAAITIPWSTDYPNNVAYYRHVPHVLLYWARGVMGDREGARREMLKALEYQPDEETCLAHAHHYFTPEEVERLRAGTFALEVAA